MGALGTTLIKADFDLFARNDTMKRKGQLASWPFQLWERVD